MAVFMLKDVNVLPGDWRNFSGRQTDYNAAGVRNFNIGFKNPEDVQMLIANGFNVKYTKERPDQPDYQPTPYLKINVGYHKDPSMRNLDPIVNVYVKGKNNPVTYDEDMVGSLDSSRIIYADIKINSREYTIAGRSGTSAYLRELNVVIEDTSFGTDYSMVGMDIGSDTESF